MSELKLAFRNLKKTPFVTGVAILSLALGIGANAAIFSLFDSILLSPLPVSEPDRLVNLSAPGPKPGSTSCNQAGDCELVFSYPMFRDLETQQTSFSGLAAHRAFGASVATGERTESGEGMMVSGSYFGVLGLRPALGRLVGMDDDRTPGAHPLTVLSHEYWMNDLGGDPGVLNSTIMINGTAMTIIGVAPRGFHGTTLGSRPDVYVPLSMRGAVDPGFNGFDNRQAYWAYVFGRLKPGTSLEQAGAELSSKYAAIVNEVEAPLQEGMSEQTMERFRSKRIAMTPGFRGQSSMHQDSSTPLLLLFAITGTVLLIACANIANLLLARGAGRNTEMAVRGSLGATRWTLLRQLMVESVMLASLGGLASILVAKWTLDAIVAMLPPEEAAVLGLGLQPSVIGFAALLALGTGLGFGVFPALHNTRMELATTLRSAGGQPSGSRAAARFRVSLVTAQIALSLALLVAAGLFIKSLANVSRVDLGIRTENMVTFSVYPSLIGYEPERRQQLFERMEEELAAIPGVTGVTAAMVPALGGSSWGGSVSVEGFERGPDIDNNSRLNHVGPGYFRTMGTPLIAGREFRPSDRVGAPLVAIVNESFVRKFGLDPRDAVGKLMARGSTDTLDMQIVGVVQDAKYNSVRDDIPPLFYAPYAQDERLGGLYFYLRTSLDDPGSVLRAAPQVVRSIEPNLPVEELKTLRDQVRESTFLDRMITTLSASFAVLATLLAAIGLYGVLAYTVTQRTREIGLRMALGAGSDRIRGMVLKQVGRMLVIGGAIGILAALALGRAASSLLFGLQGDDPVVLTIASLLLSAVAIGAGLVPALRAARVEPMEALRYE